MKKTKNEILIVAGIEELKFLNFLFFNLIIN
jgi:hypothetical protein